MRRPELLAGLALALLLRLGFTVHAYRRPEQPYAVTYDYEPIARGLLASGVYSDPPGGVPTARREPGYILFIALVYKIFGMKELWVYLAQVLLSAVTPVILYGLTKRVYSETAARAAFWGCVLYPYFIYYTAYFFREDVLAFILVSMLYVLVRWRTAGAALAAGALAGWLCLANGAWAPGCLWAVLALYATEKPGLKLKRAAAFGLPLVLIVGAWGLRNWLTFHEVIPFSSNVGAEMYIGMTVPYENLGSQAQTDQLDADPVFQAASHADGEIAKHKAYMAGVKKYFLTNPGAFLARQAEHALKIWRVLPHARAYTHSYLLIALTALGSDGILFPLALYGLWLKRRETWTRWFYLPFIATVTWSFSISQSPIRYRVPLTIIVLMLAGAGLEELLRRRRSRA